MAAHVEILQTPSPLNTFTRAHRLASGCTVDIATWHATYALPTSTSSCVVEHLGSFRRGPMRKRTEVGGSKGRLPAGCWLLHPSVPLILISPVLVLCHHVLRHHTEEELIREKGTRHRSWKVCPVLSLTSTAQFVKIGRASCRERV